MGRAPVFHEHVDINKGAWTREEDEKLVAFTEANNGHAGNCELCPSVQVAYYTILVFSRASTVWQELQVEMEELSSAGRGNFSAEEDEAIAYLQAILGNKWSTIASQLPGRTDNDIKNHWHAHVRKRLRRNHLPDAKLSFNGFNDISMITNEHSMNCNGLYEGPSGQDMLHPAYSDEYRSDRRQIFMMSQWPQPSTTLACSASGPSLVSPFNFMPIMHTPLFPSPLVEAQNLQFQTQTSVQENINIYQASNHSLQHLEPLQENTNHETYTAHCSCNTCNVNNGDLQSYPSTATAHPNFFQASDLLDGGNLLFSSFPSLPLS